MLAIPVFDCSMPEWNAQKNLPGFSEKPGSFCNIILF